MNNQSTLIEHPAVLKPEMSADDSCRLITRKLRLRNPFFFVRYGDGALECIFKGQGRTCDGEVYSQELGIALLQSWRMICGMMPDVLIGDWLTASFEQCVEHTRYQKEYELLMQHAGETCTRVHFESLLLMRESEALADFYRAVQRDSRQKLFMGPLEMRGAAKLLGADHLVTPMKDLYSQVDRLTRELEDRHFDILLWGAGMASSIVVANVATYHPERTYINLGSGLDPLFWGRKTRLRQLTPAQARNLLRDLL